MGRDRSMWLYSLPIGTPKSLIGHYKFKLLKLAVLKLADFKRKLQIAPNNCYQTQSRNVVSGVNPGGGVVEYGLPRPSVVVQTT